MANPHDDFSVAVEKVDAVYLVKLSSDHLELNLRFDQAQLGFFTNIESADWNRRGSIALGSCLGAPVFWSASENGRVSMVIGADDEVWDVGVEVSMTTLHRIRQELAQASSAQLTLTKRSSESETRLATERKADVTRARSRPDSP